ncbi:MAG: hypothetical protein JNK45_19435 [Myxococcales bacterium]|nr:hypothetical protein [Myxococcales bacterium]
MSAPEHVLRHVERELLVRLTADALVLRDASSTEPRTIPFASIRAVKLARIGTLEGCELTLDDGSARTLSTDEAACRPAWAAIVRGLYDELAPRGVPFVAGSWLVVAILVVSCVVLGIVGALLYLGVIDAPAFRRRGIVLAIVCMVLGPIGAWAARPRAVRDAAALAKHLPR